MAHAEPAANMEQDPASHSEKHVNTGNVGLDAIAGIVEHVDIDGEVARTVLRKIDMYLLPMLCFTYLIQV